MRLSDPTKSEIDNATRKTAGFAFLDFELCGLWWIMQIRGKGMIEKDLYDSRLIVRWETDGIGVNCEVMRIPG